MPGDSQAIYQSCWILLRSRGAVFAGTPSILARCLSSSMVHLSFVVSRQWPFCFSSYLVKGCGLSLLVTVHQRPQCFLSAWLPFCSICGIPFSPSILSSDPVIRDLLRSFRLSSVERVMRPPAWDLSRVLTYLVSPTFEPLSQASLCALTLKTLFLLALATAKRVGELQALSSIVTFVGADACLSYIPQFVAKSESLTRSIPRSFLVKSLADFEAGLDTDLLLCPVRALRLYLLRARSLFPGRHRLFMSPRRPSRAMSKNAVSFFLREVISAAGAARPQVGSLRAHEVRSVSTSVAFHRNWSVTSVLESATWASSSVFSSFYLRDIQHEYDGLLSLGPFVAAGSRIG